MPAVLGPFLVLFILLLILGKVIFSGSIRLTRFNPRRASTRAQSASGSNALLTLAAINLATLVFRLATLGATLQLQPAAASVAIFGTVIVGLLLSVAARPVGNAIVGAAGVGAALFSAALDHGVQGVMSILVLSLFTFWLLGFLRGVVGAR